MQHNLFTPITYTHTHENNVDSQRHYDSRKDDYSSQAEQILKLLKNGVRLTRNNVKMYVKNCNDLASRIRDLRNNGHRDSILLSIDKIEGCKYYYYKVNN